MEQADSTTEVRETRMVIGHYHARSRATDCKPHLTKSDVRLTLQQQLLRGLNAPVLGITEPRYANRLLRPRRSPRRKRRNRSHCLIPFARQDTPLCFSALPMLRQFSVGCGSFAFEARALSFNRIDEECRVHTPQMRGISGVQGD